MNLKFVAISLNLKTRNHYYFRTEKIYKIYLYKKYGKLSNIGILCRYMKTKKEVMEL